MLVTSGATAPMENCPPLLASELALARGTSAKAKLRATINRPIHFLAPAILHHPLGVLYSSRGHCRNLLIFSPILIIYVMLFKIFVTDMAKYY